MTSALCWAHARRKFFVLTNIAGKIRKGKLVHDISPVALDAVTRTDALFDIERELNGLNAETRREARQPLSRPLVEGLRDWPPGDAEGGRRERRAIKCRPHP